MNIHLIRSAEFESERFWEVVNLLRKYPGILQFKTREEPLVIHDDAVREQSITAEVFHSQEKDSSAVHETRRVEVVTWDTIFGRCTEYRRKYDIGTNEFVVLLTDYNNDKNWFAAGDPRGERNLFIQTRYWDCFSGSDLRYPVAYHTVTGILKKLMFRFSREALLIQVELLFPLLAAVDLGTQVVEWKGNSQRLRTSSQMGAGRIHL